MRSFACVAFATAFAAGCATPPPADDTEAMAAYKEANDPYEPFNRAMFELNLTLDKAILRPTAFVYKEAVPDPFRYNVHSFLENLRGPVIFLNDMLQGEWDRAGTTLLRFAMNSTIGLAGITDFAGEAGIEKHSEDFGQTLAIWGLDSGPYLVLPVLGPSSPRDAVGFGVDAVASPWGYIADSTAWSVGTFAGSAVDSRARNYDQINDLERTSLDFYATVRSLHRQRRAEEIRNGAPSPIKVVPGGLSVTPQTSGSDGEPQDQNISTGG